MQRVSKIDTEWDFLTLLQSFRGNLLYLQNLRSSPDLALAQLIDSCSNLIELLDRHLTSKPSSLAGNRESIMSQNQNPYAQSDHFKGIVTSPSPSTGTLLQERGKTHGEYRVHANITQNLKAVMHRTEGWEGLNDIQRESLEMFAHKIGRILAGDPNFADHWDDIAGYARLVSERLPK